MSKSILLLGSGGHFHSVLDSVMAAGDYDRIGLIVKNETERDRMQDPAEKALVAGTDDDLERLVSEGWEYAFVAVGSIGNTSLRERLFRILKEYGYIIPVIRDPAAVIASRVQLEEGTYIGKKAVINAGSKVRKCAIINTGAIIEHDCEIGEFAHVSSGAVLCGGVDVGSRTHIGAGSAVRQQIRIGEDVLIGVGSVVVKDIPGGSTAYGNPCRVRP